MSVKVKQARFYFAVFAFCLLLNLASVFTNESVLQWIGSGVVVVGCAIFLFAFYSVIRAAKRSETYDIRSQTWTGLLVVLTGFVIKFMDFL